MLFAQAVYGYRRNRLFSAPQSPAVQMLRRSKEIVDQ